MVELLGPEELVAEEGHGHGGDAGGDGGRGGAGAAVVDDGGHAAEQPIVRDAVDAQDGGGQGDVGEVAPAREEEAALVVRWSAST